MSNKTSIEVAIQQLLYKNERVIIPQLGAFSKAYKPTGFDYVQGIIMPPSSTITFNEHIVVDDGILIDFYQKENEISVASAQQAIWDFAHQTRQALKNKQVIALPSVGKLMLDHEQKITFVSEQQNFNTATFGLPEIQFQPIPRAVQQAKENINTETATAIAKPSRLSRASKKAIKMGGALLLTAAIVIGTIWVWKSSRSDDAVATQTEIESATNDDYRDDSVKRKVNLGPSDTLSGTTDDEIDYSNEIGEETDVESEVVAKEEIIAQDRFPKEELIKDVVEQPMAPPPTPKAIPSATKKQVIFVGLFSKAKGVDLMTARILDYNWIPYTERKAKGTRVGIIVPADKNPNAMLKEVRRKIEPGAFMGKR